MQYQIASTVATNNIIILLTYDLCGATESMDAQLQSFVADLPRVSFILRYRAARRLDSYMQIPVLNTLLANVHLVAWLELILSLLINIVLMVAVENRNDQMGKGAPKFTNALGDPELVKSFVFQMAMLHAILASTVVFNHFRLWAGELIMRRLEAKRQEGYILGEDGPDMGREFWLCIYTVHSLFDIESGNLYYILFLFFSIYGVAYSP
eukprot:SAG31_NODE_494_length_14867_cov_2.833762_5_plen_209_part_00